MPSTILRASLPLPSALCVGGAIDGHRKIWSESTEASDDLHAQQWSDREQVAFDALLAATIASPADIATLSDYIVEQDGAAVFDGRYGRLANCISVAAKRMADISVRVMDAEIMKRQARNADLYCDMESEVHDLGNMAHATSLLLDLYMEEKALAAARGNLTGADLVKHLESWSKAVDFMVNHLNTMVHQLRRHYA